MEAESSGQLLQAGGAIAGDVVMFWGAVGSQGGECTDWPGRYLLFLQSDPSLILHCQACNISLHPF